MFDENFVPDEVVNPEAEAEEEAAAPAPAPTEEAPAEPKGEEE